MRKLAFSAIVVLTAALAASPALGQMSGMVFGGLGYGKLVEQDEPEGSVGFSGGFIVPLGTSSAAIGLEGHYIILGENERTWRFNNDTIGRAEVKRSSIPITAQLYYFIPRGGGAGAYLDAGAGVYYTRTNAKGTLIDDDGNDAAIVREQADTETDAGVNVGGGLRFGGAEDGSIGLGIDAKYHIIFQDERETDMVSLFGRIFFM
jgi:hypothetical protein